MSDLTEWIKERRDVLNSDRDLVAEDMAVRQFPDLLTAVEKVLELHQPEYLIRDGEWFPASCAVCEPWTWPCETVRSIEGAIQSLNR